MSKFIIAILIIGIAFSTKVDKKFLDFQDFISKYHKSYDSPSEFMEKFEVFKENQKIIKKNSPKKLSNGKAKICSQSIF